MANGSDGRAGLNEIDRVARDPNLAPEAKVLWLIYRSYEAEDGGGAFPGDETVSRHMGRSPRTVRRYRKDLLELGYLRRELRGPKEARYWATLPEEREEKEGRWGLGDLPTFESWNGEASRFFAEGVQQVLWRSKQPPPDAPDGWSMAADLKRIKVAWTNLGTAGTVRRLRGLRYLADAGELPVQGTNGEARPLEPGEGFTLGLLEHYREDGKWREAERRFRERHEDGTGEDPLGEAVAFVQGEGGAE